MKKEQKPWAGGSRIKVSKSRKVFNFFNITLLGLFSFATFYPFWYVLIVAFNTGRDTLKGGMWIWPRSFTLENFQMAFRDERMLPSLWVSIFITVTTVVFSLILMSAVAYAMSVRAFPGRSAFAFFWYFTTLFGGGMIPYYLLLRTIGLNKSIWLYVLPSLYSFSRFIMIRTYFQNIPYELRESAELDGAGHMKIMMKIYMPLAKPMLATQGLLIGVSKWNSWFDGVYYQTNKNLRPAATILRLIMDEAASNLADSEERVQSMVGTGGMVTYTTTSIQYAFVVLLTVPVIIAYPFLQKYFVKGMLVGSVKG